MQQDKSPHPVAGAGGAGAPQIIRMARMAGKGASQARKGCAAGRWDSLFHAKDRPSAFADVCLTISVKPATGIAAGRSGDFVNTGRKGASLSAGGGIARYLEQSPEPYGDMTKASDRTDAPMVAIGAALERSAGCQTSGAN